MTRYLTYCIAALLLWCGPAAAQSKARATNVPEIPYESVPNFIKMPPGLYLGESMGVASNSKGHIFVFTRSGDTRLFEFDETGKYVRELGEGLYGFEYAHKVRVDKYDNIWAVDEGTNMVIKFNPEGRVTMVLGRRPEQVDGAYTTPPNQPQPPTEKYLFRRPTDVAFGPNDEIFVSDGYVNHRVVKYDKNGRFMKEVGGSAPGSAPYQMNTPHGISTDALGNVYVADRANVRLQVFDINLVLRAIYDNIGNSWETCVSPGPHQYLFSSNSNPNGNGPGTWETTGEIYKMELDGTIVGRFGKPGKQLGGFQVVHGIDCRNPNEILVSEIESWRVQKLMLKPATAKPAAAR
ncbi:MAG: peptidyl-alpha-hydroxyglycine alpha-amidating lyase family protein [Vicinamibacterales bacterium]|nr:peptidyl-alpha-hydroxyglycine alpha-amidating lyase family protein [Vicinamibacterales bacterium]